jgi:Putative sensor
VSDVGVPGAQPRRSWVEAVFGVMARLQTWKNMAYLALAFPLALFYLVFLVVGLALGIGLVIIWVGLPILAVVVLAWWAFASFERLQAEHLLGVPTTGRLAPWEGGDSWWQRVKRHLGDAGTWKDLSFLFVKFPLGVVSLVIVTLAVGVPAALIGAPFYYHYVDWTTNGVSHHGINMGAWHVDTLGEALLLVPIGLVVLIAGLHLANVFARFSGILAGALLDEGRAASLPPQSATPPPSPGAPQEPPAPETPAAPPQTPGAAPETPALQPRWSGAPWEPSTPSPQAPPPPQAPQPASQPLVPPHIAGTPEAGQ